METTEILKGETGDSRYQNFSSMSVSSYFFVLQVLFNDRYCFNPRFSVLYPLGLEKIIQFSAELNPTDVKADYSIRMKMKKLFTVYDKVSAVQSNEI